jgi:polyphosphate kinase 2
MTIDHREQLERIKAEIADSFDEELEMQLEEDRLDALVVEGMSEPAADTLERKVYFRELFRLQHELVKLQDWVQHRKLKVVVVFEGRDSAGKGGAIKHVTQRLNPRVCRVVALPAPTERERNQWYFQRYVAHLPTTGEMVLFDRSWYNRAGVERVMGFCTPGELEEFFRSVPEFERMLVRSGIILIRYWFSITDEEQEFRFRMRIHDPLKQWKLSPMDLDEVRAMIFGAAAEDRRIGGLTETLKWDEPAYLAASGSGSTIRLGVSKLAPDRVAVFFHCRTTLVADFRNRFGGAFAYEGNRAVLLPVKDLDRAGVRFMLGSALTYHLRGRR